MSTRHSLLQLLADGAFHSGTDLGGRLGVSRAAVNKALHGLAEQGLDIHSIPGRGYRLSEPFVPLSASAIGAALAPRAVSIEVLEETASTSEYLLQFAAHQPSGRVCLAEAQRAGRGRRGRGWIATPFHNLVMSMSWRFESGPAALAGLSLAAGVAVVRALHGFGVADVALKWPNDVLFDRRKLAGLLVDVRGEAAGPSWVVLGLGLNIHIAPGDAARIDQPWAALREVLPGPVDRNRLAALVVQELANAFETFARRGFEPFAPQWEQHHAYRNREVRLQLGTETVTGTVVGIDEQGNLRLRDPRGAIRAYHSGEVSLRAES